MSASVVCPTSEVTPEPSPYRTLLEYLCGCPLPERAARDLEESLREDLACAAYRCVSKLVSRDGHDANLAVTGLLSLALHALTGAVVVMTPQHAWCAIRLVAVHQDIGEQTLRTLTSQMLDAVEELVQCPTAQNLEHLTRTCLGAYAAKVRDQTRMVRRSPRGLPESAP